MTDTPPKPTRRRWRWLVVLESMVGAESRRIRSLRDATTDEWRSLQHPDTRLIAPENQAQLSEERERCRTLSREFAIALEEKNVGSSNRRSEGGINSPSDNSAVRRELAQLSLPALYRRLREEGSDFALKEPRFKTCPNPGPLVRVIAFLDSEPIASPQLLKPALMYRLTFRLRGLAWPAEALRLRLDFLSTCPSTEYTASQFIVERPSIGPNGEFEAESTGQIKFATAQSTAFDDLVFALRGAFESTNGEIAEVPVIGHHELRLRVVGDDSHPLMTGSRRLDRHVYETLSVLRRDGRIEPGESDDLLLVMQALVKLHAAYAQEAAWKGRVDVHEDEFQRTVLRDLRLTLGPEVQEHTQQGGGITDIGFKGIVIELKIERQNGDRKSLLEKYGRQATQYAGAVARQVSIVLVLDLTEKSNPAGDIRNDILVGEVHTHGGPSTDKPYPSKAVLFVINGNTKSPSAYSR